MHIIKGRKKNGVEGDNKKIILNYFESNPIKRGHKKWMIQICEKYAKLNMPNQKQAHKYSCQNF